MLRFSWFFRKIIIQFYAAAQKELQRGGIVELAWSYRRFPNDDEFKRELQTRDLYNFPRRSYWLRSYWLRRMENHGRKERVVVDEYTIEHILPQNENLSSAWKTALGPDWEHIRGTWLYTLGNAVYPR